MSGKLFDSSYLNGIVKLHNDFERIAWQAYQISLTYIPQENLNVECESNKPFRLQGRLLVDFSQKQIQDVLKGYFIFGEKHSVVHRFLAVTLEYPFFFPVFDLLKQILKKFCRIRCVLNGKRMHLRQNRNSEMLKQSIQTPFDGIQIGGRFFMGISERQQEEESFGLLPYGLGGITFRGDLMKQLILFFRCLISGIQQNQRKRNSAFTRHSATLSEKVGEGGLGNGSVGDFTFRRPR